MSTTLAFVGLPPQRLPWGNNEASSLYRATKIAVQGQIVKLIHQENVSHTICGMALGADWLCARAVLDLRAQGHEVSLEAILSCRDQSEGWSLSSRLKYHALLKHCDIMQLVENTGEESDDTECNRQLIQKADFLMAVWDGIQPGCAQEAVELARQRGLAVVVVHPRTQSVRYLYGGIEAVSKPLTEV